MIGQSGLLVHSNPTTASDDAQAAPTDPNGKRGEFAQAMADTETSPATQGKLSSTEAGTDTEPRVGLRRVEASLAMQVETTPDLARPIERSPETRNDRTTFQQEPPSAPRGLKAASELPAVSLTLNKEVNALSANGAVASDRFSPSSNGEAVAELSSGSSVMSDITRLIPSSDSCPKNEAQANKELPTSIFANPQTAAELETDVPANPSLEEIGQQVWGAGREWAGLSDTVNKQIGIGLADSPPKPEQTLPSSNPPATKADESAIITTSVGATLPTEAAQQRQLTANLPSPPSADAGLIPSRVDPDADGAQLQGGRGMGTHHDPEASNNYWRSAAVPTDAKAIFSHDDASSRSEQKLQTAVVQPGVESESLLNAPPTDGPRSATTYVTASAQAELGFNICLLRRIEIGIGA